MIADLDNKKGDCSWLEKIEKSIQLKSKDQCPTSVKNLYLILRYILTGKTMGGPFQGTLSLLGQEVVLYRLKHFKLSFLPRPPDDRQVE